MPFTIPLGLYACFHLIRAFQVTGNLEILLMPCAGVAIIIAGFHDVLIMNHLWDRTDGMYSQFNTILVGMFFSLLLLNRFARSLQQAEDLSLTLEQRIQTKTLELQGQYKQLNVLENEKILSEERERIMRDMHDGMGGQLISISTILHGHHGEIFQQIRDKIRISLADFRLVIDSLDPLLNDLPTLLGMMRSRLTEQLKAENITLEWAVTDLPELNNMSPRRSLHIMRIVQESITNSIKHAHTQRMKLSTYVEGSHSRYIVIKIQDFGPGLNEENLTLTQGRGIKNMYYRADQIGARFEIASFKERDNVMGTSVILKLPL
jgi:signal transduction histidine kinase